MRVAVCLHGMLSLKKGKIEQRLAAVDDIEVPYNQFKHHLFNKNDKVDVFLHVRNPQYEEKLVELYQPKRYLSEPFAEFDTSKFCTGNQPVDHQIMHSKAQWSRFYSLFKSVEQKRQYEEENGFKYDCVFISRYDLLAFEDFIFSDYNMEYFHAPFSIWHMKAKNYFVKESIPDLWFFSSSEQIDDFSKIFLGLPDIARDLGGNCTSPHFTVTKKLRESNSKLRFVLNADVHQDDDISRCAIARMRDAKYWGYNEEAKIYYLKEEYKKHLNNSYWDIDWKKYYQDHWSCYKGKKSEEWSKSTAREPLFP
tara:strand:+ start:18356 stop:19282 length:927 start_codon:yes stop_codon:yes gene_type:complete